MTTLKRIKELQAILAPVVPGMEGDSPEFDKLREELAALHAARSSRITSVSYGKDKVLRLHSRGAVHFIACDGQAVAAAFGGKLPKLGEDIRKYVPFAIAL